ncbi:hypothetical protein XM38_017010 [Halomicronema hongdechloris C2206]|uniref:Uncharacterized protein n=1 Tax=Halomicronema hongdechloris C2206 TaxID=1641165 RepID=A0A1Z3HKD7_9CYAN|nr:hypothetical protein [Halomicronema hongdechloris]ASC70755.1 hypothetical protein XM38_017010 [Halomicronema hongdechloris C2206]
MKIQRKGLLLLLLLLSCLSYSWLGNLDLPLILKGYVLIAPLQLLALMYVAHWNWSRRETLPPG